MIPLQGGVAEPRRSARFRTPRSLALDAAGNLFVADSADLKRRAPSDQLVITVEPKPLPIPTP